MSDNSQHLAVQANLKSIHAAMNKDREGWLALYAEDAIISDPVGKSPLDPEGNGHRGKQAIADFYDNIIAYAEFEMRPGQHLISGEYACAVPMQVINQLGDGVTTSVDLIGVYHVNKEGLITSMNAYWDFGSIEQQLADAFEQNG
ncbi:MAG: SnoaL-like domain-containing protein [Gammaproteobacteria bacterium]|nr:SnoaL-like domain-containing protein [Gammaproteobacteria bacterium]